MFSTNQNKAGKKIIRNRIFSHGAITKHFQKKESHYSTTNQRLSKRFFFFRILRNVPGVIEK